MRRNNSIGYLARLMTISYFFAFILLFVISVIKGLGAGDDQLWPQLSKITTSSLKGGAAGAMLGLFYWMLAEKFSWITGSINGAKRKWALSKLIRYCSILAFYFTLMIAVIHVILYFAKGGREFLGFIFQHIDLYTGMGTFGACIGVGMWLSENLRNA